VAIRSTKWIIWTLNKLGLAQGLRRVPDQKILLAELAETQRKLQSKLTSLEPASALHEMLEAAYARLQEVANSWSEYKDAEMEISREMLHELRREVRMAIEQLRQIGALELA